MVTQLLQQALGRLSVLPLYGGGFWVAFTQLTVFYYAMGAALHFVLPRIAPVKSIQHQPRKRGEVLRDAFYSLGAMKFDQITVICVLDCDTHLRESRHPQLRMLHV